MHMQAKYRMSFMSTEHELLKLSMQCCVFYIEISPMVAWRIWFISCYIVTVDWFNVTLLQLTHFMLHCYGGSIVTWIWCKNESTVHYIREFTSPRPTLFIHTICGKPTSFTSQHHWFCHHTLSWSLPQTCAVWLILRKNKMVIKVSADKKICYICNIFSHWLILW